MLHEPISPEMLERLRQRAADPHRRTDAARFLHSKADLGSLLNALGPAAGQLQGMQIEMKSAFGALADLMKGFGVVAPMPVGDRATGRDRTPLPPPATEDPIRAAETALGRELPADLKHLYGEVADGGFGPGAGLFSIAQAVEAHREMSDEPAGPQGQEWPAGLCPLVDNEPGYSCIDLDSGEMIDWDPEEIEGYSDAAWRRSFKPSGTTFGAWIDRWNNAESR